MVRVKNRYLLVNILYPKREKNVSKSDVPDVVIFNQPTTNALTPQALLRAIRTQVSELFGDYGSGAISESLAVKYLSPATSTFILRVSRAHYQIVWAALSFMDSIPVKNGKRCVFRVVRVSGTIRKAEEEAIRRAKDIVVKARRQMAEKGDSTLSNIFGAVDENKEAEATKDALMVDGSDSEGADNYMSDGDG